MGHTRFSCLDVIAVPTQNSYRAAMQAYSRDDSLPSLEKICRAYVARTLPLDSGVESTVTLARYGNGPADVPLGASQSSVVSCPISDDISLIGGSMMAHLLDRLDETSSSGTVGWICLRCAARDQHCEVVHADYTTFQDPRCSEGGKFFGDDIDVDLLTSSQPGGKRHREDDV